MRNTFKSTYRSYIRRQAATLINFIGIADFVNCAVYSKLAELEGSDKKSGGGSQV